jgi:hypothetical protein
MRMSKELMYLTLHLGLCGEDEKKFADLITDKYKNEATILNQSNGVYFIEVNHPRFMEVLDMITDRMAIKYLEKKVLKYD